MKKTIFLTLTIGAIVTASFMSSCKKSSDSTVTKTLYDSLGGTTMVDDPSNAGQKIEQGRLNLRSVVDSTIFVIAADDSINHYFTVLLAEVGGGNLTGFTALSKNLTDFFCVASGAKNFTYSGKSMVDAHNPATNSRMNGKAGSDAFNQFVTDLVAGATKCGVSTQLIGQVGALVNTQKSFVVQR